MKHYLLTIFYICTFSAFASETNVQSEHAELLNQDLKNQLREDKEFRKLVRSMHKSEDAKLEVAQRLESLFGQAFPFYVDTIDRLEVGVIIGKFATGGHRGSDTIFGIGPALGVSKNYEVLFCTGFNSSQENTFGTSATAVLGVGIVSGVYVGWVGMCVRLGVAYGLNAGATVDYYQVP